MANLLRWGAAFVADTLAAVAADSFAYVRGAGGTNERRFPVPAVLGQAEKVTAQPAEVNNAEVAANEWDFIVRVADFPAALCEPREGDRLCQTVGGTDRVYEVSPPTYGTEPAWRYADPHHTQYRIHTKLLKAKRDRE